jgi:hypothetical protein
MKTLTALCAASWFLVLASGCGRDQSSSSGTPPEAAADGRSDSGKPGPDATADTSSPDDGGARVCNFTIATCDGHKSRLPVDGSISVGDNCSCTCNDQVDIDGLYPWCRYEFPDDGGVYLGSGCPPCADAAAEPCRMTPCPYP